MVCDESGPLASVLPQFDAWIGREDKRSIRLGDRQIDFGFNLAGPITLAKSHDSAGVQLADVLAAVAVAAAADPSDGSGAIHPDGIVPEHDRLDLDLPEARLNVLILFELLRRSEAGESLTVGLPGFVSRASEAV